MRINLGSRYGAVTQQRLDISYVHPCLQERRGEGVAKHVGSDIARGSNAVEMLMYDATDGLWRQGSSAAVDEDGVLRSCFRSVFRTVFVKEHYKLRCRQLNHSLLPPLPPNQQPKLATGQQKSVRRE